MINFVCWAPPVNSLLINLSKLERTIIVPHHVLLTRVGVRVQFEQLKALVELFYSPSRIESVLLPVCREPLVEHRSAFPVLVYLMILILGLSDCASSRLLIAWFPVRAPLIQGREIRASSATSQCALAFFEGMIESLPWLRVLDLFENNSSFKVRRVEVAHYNDFLRHRIVHMPQIGLVHSWNGIFRLKS